MVSDISKISACFLGNHLSFIPSEPMWHDSSVNSEAAATQLIGVLKISWKVILALSYFTGTVVDISQSTAKKIIKVLYSRSFLSGPVLFIICKTRMTLEFLFWLSG